MSGPVTPVRVVIVHWNQPEECVATVDQLLYGSLPVRVTVVDNASERTARAELGAGLAERIDERLVEIIDAPTNLGFGPGANLGLRAFLERTDEGDWVFLAPHDVQVAEDTIETILAAAAAVGEAQGRPAEGRGISHPSQAQHRLHRRYGRRQVNGDQLPV